MNDGASILVAVFLILLVLRWMLGGQQQGQQQGHQRSQQRTTTRRIHRVTPQMIEMVRAMFPDVPTAAIQADLQRTGSVETTVDNALRDGGLPLPATATAPPPSPSSPHANTSGSSSSKKSTQYGSLLQRFKLDEQRLAQSDEIEPPKIWESDAAKRQETLKKRKEFMVLQARKKLMEQQKKQQSANLPIDTSSSAERPSVDSFPTN